MRRLLPSIAAVLVAVVIPAAAAGQSSLPSYTEPNGPGSITVPFNLSTPPARPAVRTYDQLLALWQSAGQGYGVPWQVLAAINKIESNFGQNMGPSSAGALGWMQFIPSSWMRWGMAKGLAERVVAWRHVLRNALLPVASIVGLQVGSMFAGAVLVEFIFSWPGMNALLLSALGTRDYPVIQGVVLLGSTLFVAVNLLTDLCYVLLNPRIRYG